MRAKLRSKFTLLFIVCAVLIAIPGAAALAQDTGTSPAPTIQSDKADYAPGELVTLTGSGWQPGELVNIVVNDDEGQTWNRNVNVTADASGNISDSFNLPNWFVATYKVTTTGAQSGVATTMFTDGNVNVKANLTGTETWTLVDGARYNSSNTCSPASNRQLSSVQSNVTLTGSNQLATAFGANSGQTVRLTASASSSGGKTFDKWTDPSGNAVSAWDDPSTTNVETDKKVICVSGFNGSGTNVYTANYVAATVNTTTTASNASATYGDSNATLNATVTPASGTVNNGTVTFTVKNGATTVGTVTSGTVVNNSASASFLLSGVNAGSYTIEAAYNAGSGFNNSNNSTQSPAPTLTVDKKTVTGSFTADNKVYDGTTSATILTRSLTGKVGTDDVSLSGGSATFADKNVGTAKTVTGTGFSLTGTKANNYTLASSTLTTTADITPRAITVTAASDTKVYDGTTSSNGTPTVTTGSLASGDTATFTQAFANKNVGTGKTLTPSGSVNDGNGGNNYQVTFVNNNGVITAKSVTGSFTATDKEYDGNASATITSRSLQGEISGDQVSLTGGTASFNDKNVGTNKPVSGSGFVLAGADKDNYTLTSVSNTTASITAKALTGSFTASNKVYDGTRDATVASTSLPSVINGDQVTLQVSNPQFDNKNVGTNKDVTGSLSLTGNDAGNYTVNASHTAKADITALGITGSFTASNKVYDGDDSATVTDRSLNGQISGDDVSLTGGTAKFNNKNVGTNKPVTLSGASLSGTDAGNYNLTSVSDAEADITARDLTVSATGQNKVYDGNTNATVTLSTNKLNGDDVTASYTSASFDNKNAGTGKNVSVNGISISGADAGNYTFNTTASTTATIAPRPITITAQAKSKLFGDPDPPLTYQVSDGPLVSGDSFTGALTREPGEAVGQYNILQGTVKVSDGNNGDNYLITYNGAKLTIGAWTFNGFYQPVDMSTSTTTVWNTVKGGSTVPLKFKLFKGATELTDTSNVKPLQYAKVSCSTGTGTEDAIETLATGGTSLRYDTTGGQFIYNWKTPAGAGFCYKVTVTAQDGSTISAHFKMK